MKPVTMYTTAVCPYCIRAKQVLSAKGVADIKETASTWTRSSATK